MQSVSGQVRIGPSYLKLPNESGDALSISVTGQEAPRLLPCARIGKIKAESHHFLAWMLGCISSMSFLTPMRTPPHMWRPSSAIKPSSRDKSTCKSSPDTRTTERERERDARERIKCHTHTHSLSLSLSCYCDRGDRRAALSDLSTSCKPLSRPAGMTPYLSHRSLAA